MVVSLVTVMTMLLIAKFTVVLILFSLNHFFRSDDALEECSSHIAAARLHPCSVHQTASLFVKLHLCLKKFWQGKSPHFQHPLLDLMSSFLSDTVLQV